MGSRSETINLIGDQIRKRQLLINKFRREKTESGRLLAIMAK